MGKNKAAKTTEENARKMLEKILNQVPTNLGTVKYTRHHSLGSQTQRFNSNVCATRDEDDAKRRSLYKDYCIEKIKAAFEGRKMSEQLRSKGPLNELKRNVKYRRERMQERLEVTQQELGQEPKPNPIAARRLSQGMSSMVIG